MSKGISRRIKKLSRFLDNGGIILKVKLKGKSSDIDNYIRNFHEVDIHTKPIIYVKWYYHNIGSHVVCDYGQYKCPVLSISVKNCGSSYYKDPYINVTWPISNIRYMLVLYPDGLIKTIWL